VEPDYFSGLDVAFPKAGLVASRVVAWVHPYRHGRHGDEVEAHALYELSLRYYVLGLAFAGSPYAFPTIGSTMTFCARAYAETRGFPKLEAAEDFYLFNKLAKLGQVRKTAGKVRLRPRHSQRVPFGTGVATRKIAELRSESRPFTVYHPRAFELLRAWLEALSTLTTEGDTEALFRRFQTEPDGELLTGILESSRAKKALETAARTRPRKEDRFRHLHTWFDALSTLRFIHEVTNRKYPKLPLAEALSQAPFLPGRPNLAELDDGW
jgi:hypothetical protein